MRRFLPYSSRTIAGALVVVAVAACADSDRVPLTAPSRPVFARGSCALGMSDAQVRTFIADLLTAVNALEASGALNAGQAGALRNHLQSALAAIDSGNYCAAQAKLQAFRE